MKKTSQEIVAGIDAQISKLTARKNAEIQKQKKAERDARTSRLVKRGGILESLIEDAKSFTNDQIHALLKEALESDVAQVILMEMREHNAIATQIEQERIAAAKAQAEAQTDTATQDENEVKTATTADTSSDPKPAVVAEQIATVEPAETSEQNATPPNENPTWTTGQTPNPTNSKPNNAPPQNQTPTSKNSNSPTNNRNQHHNNNRSGKPKQGVTPSN